MDKPFHYQVSSSDRVQSLADQIAKPHGISGSVVFKQGDRRLVMSDTFANNQIHDHAILNLCPTGSVVVRIQVVGTERIFQWKVAAHFDVGSIKDQVRRHSGLAPEHQRLVLENPDLTVVLEKDQTYLGVLPLSAQSLIKVYVHNIESPDVFFLKNVPVDHAKTITVHTPMGLTFVASVTSDQTLTNIWYQVRQIDHVALHTATEYVQMVAIMGPAARKLPWGVALSEMNLPDKTDVYTIVNH